MLRFDPNSIPKIEEHFTANLNELKFDLFPCPAKHKVTFKFWIPTKKDISIKIYDIQGRLVQSLLTESKAGKNILTWNALDSTGKPVANGVYFCTFDTDDQTITKKIVLLH